MAEIPERLAKAADEAEERIAAQLGPSSARDAVEAMWPAIEALAEVLVAAGVQAGREAAAAEIQEGRCGVPAPSLSHRIGHPSRPVCALPYGHKSAWHRSDEGTEWGPSDDREVWRRGEIPEEASGIKPGGEWQVAYERGVQAGRAAAAADIDRTRESIEAAGPDQFNIDYSSGMAYAAQIARRGIARGDNQEER